MNEFLNTKVAAAHDKVAAATYGDCWVIEVFEKGCLHRTEPLSAVLGKHPQVATGESKDFTKSRGGTPSDTEQDRFLSVLQRDLTKSGMEVRKLSKGGNAVHVGTGEKWKITAVLDEDHDSPYVNFRLETK